MEEWVNTSNLPQVTGARPSRHPVKSTHSSSFPKTLDHWGNPLGNPLKFTHSSTFSLKLLPLRNFPQSIHPLFNFPSQMEVPEATHPLFNFSIIRWSQQAGRAGKRQESPSPVEELVQSFPKSTLAFSKPAPIARTNSLSSLTLQLSRPVQ